MSRASKKKFKDSLVYMRKIAASLRRGDIQGHFIASLLTSSADDMEHRFQVVDDPEKEPVIAPPDHPIPEPIMEEEK